MSIVVQKSFRASCSLLLTVFLLCACEPNKGKDKPAEKTTQPAVAPDTNTVKAPPLPAADTSGGGLAAADTSTGKPPPVEPPPIQPEASPRPVLADLGAAQFLPAETMALAAASGFGPLATKLGHAELTAKYKDYYEKGVAKVTQEIGTNILDPAQHAQIGIDSSAPFGGAMLDTKSKAGVFFVSLSDAEKFKTMLYSLAAKGKKELEPQAVGDALILSPQGGDDTNIVIRNNIAFFVMAETPESSLSQAQRIANMTPINSLAGSADFKKATALVKSGEDMGFYFVLGSMLRSMVEANAQHGLNPDENWAKKALEEGKAAKVSADELKFLEEQWTREQGDLDARRKAFEAEQKLLDKVFTGMGAFVVGLDIRKEGVLATAHMSLEPSSLLAQILTNTTAPSRLLTALDKTPLYVQYGNVKADVYLEFLLAGMELQSEYDKIRDALKTEIGIDLQTELVSILTGEIGFAVTGDLDPTSEPEAMLQALGGVITIGINNPVKAQALLDKLAAHPKIAPFAKKENNGYSVPVPGWKPVYVTVTDGHIVISDDLTVSDRVASGATGAFFSNASNPGLQKIVTAPDSAAFWLLDSGGISALGWLVMARGTDRSGMDPMTRKNLKPEQLKKLEEYEAVVKELEELHARENKENMASIEALATPFGSLALRAVKVDGGVALEGGLYINADSVPSLIDNTIEHALKLKNAGDTYSTQRKSIEAKRWKLEEELNAMGLSVWGSGPTSSTSKAMDKPKPLKRDAPVAVPKNP